LLSGAVFQGWWKIVPGFGNPVGKRTLTKFNTGQGLLEAGVPTVVTSQHPALDDARFYIHRIKYSNGIFQSISFEE